MPRGIYNRTPLKKKAVKKKLLTPEVDRVVSTPIIKRELSIKDKIIDTLKKRHIEYADMDGHIAIGTVQMVDASALLDLLGDGLQAMNTRKGKNGVYIALYY